MIGGISGVILAIFPVDWQLTDTYFVVAHLHYVLFGGSVFGIFAGLYYWFPKMTGRMMSEALGKTSFWLMFIGFNVTFLVQHSAGPVGHAAPDLRLRRARSASATYNLISTIGAFILGIGVLVTVVNVLHSDQARQAGRATTRGRATRSSGSPRSPPPPNNFDVIPRVRSVEPMKDIRREVAAAAVAGGDGRAARGAAQPGLG